MVLRSLLLKNKIGGCCASKLAVPTKAEQTCWGSARIACSSPVMILAKNAGKAAVEPRPRGLSPTALFNPYLVAPSDIYSLVRSELIGLQPRRPTVPATTTKPNSRFTRPELILFSVSGALPLERRLRKDAARVWSAGQPENPNRASASVTWDGKTLKHGI
jgi:hypothetical protein